jgi:hypothetical protein
MFTNQRREERRDLECDALEARKLPSDLHAAKNPVINIVRTPSGTIGNLMSGYG